jgi:hypothetical protein
MPLANELALSAAMTTPLLILMETLLKDLRQARRDWALDRECYTLGQVANLLRTFLSKEKAAAYAGEVRARV